MYQNQKERRELGYHQQDNFSLLDEDLLVSQTEQMFCHLNYTSFHFLGLYILRKMTPIAYHNLY